jgi:hypothetical protein
MMKYLLWKYGNEYIIVNDAADFRVGTVHCQTQGPRFVVSSDYDDDCAVIARVNSLDEVIPAFAAYCEANPPQWRRDDGYPCGSETDAPGRRGARYVKQSPFGPFWVDEVDFEHWVAYRNDHELLHGEQIAVFATCEVAQRAADAHERDNYPNSPEPINDGFSWMPDPEVDWRNNPEAVAGRATCVVSRSE